MTSAELVRTITPAPGERVRAVNLSWEASGETR